MDQGVCVSIHNNREGAAHDAVCCRDDNRSALRAACRTHRAANAQIQNYIMTRRVARSQMGGAVRILELRYCAQAAPGEAQTSARSRDREALCVLAYLRSGSDRGLVRTVEARSETLRSTCGLTPRGTFSRASST
eukprot:4365015-Prymnesium_polylepis.1